MGKGVPIGTLAAPTTPIGVAAIVVPDSSDKDVFVLARKIEEILKGESNKTCLKVMNMVGSLHAIRCIPSDRPIGQSTAGTTKVVPKAKAAKRGLSTPKAAWKQTDAYKHLSATRALLVKTIKALDPADPSLTGHVEELRACEQSLKALKSPTAGDH